MFLKGWIAKKVLNDEECRDYLIRIIALSLNLEEEEVRKNIRLVDTSVGNKQELMHQETDVLLENDFFNVEINYNYCEEGMIKNSCYIANLMIRQFESGKGYKHFKKINQVNLNNYDLFKEGKYLYRSRVMEESCHIVRDDLIEIVDINLDFLSNIEYTEIKKFNEYDLQWLLYLFVCSENNKRKEIYHDTNFMRMVERMMNNLTKNLNEMLYYDPEEFRKNAEYKEGERDGEKKETNRNCP